MVSDPGQWIELELELAPDDAARLIRVPELARLRSGRARATQVRMVWHDTPAAALAEDGTVLCEHRLGRETTWRIERMRGAPDAPWLPGAPSPLLDEAAERSSLGRALPAPLLPVAAFEGTLRVLALAEAAGTRQVTLLDGVLRAVAGERPVCRLMLSGLPAETEALALALAAHVRLCVPAASLASEAYAVSGRAVPPAASGAPILPTGVSVGDAFARIAGHLAAVLLCWASSAAPSGGEEPVHQMRVAVRRLRSALSLFGRAVGCTELDAVHADLRALMRVLGPARDWDVFVNGTGRAVGRAFTDDRAVARLLAAAERRRLDAYAALDGFLHGAGFRTLGIRLACLVAGRPWEHPPATLDDDPARREAADKQMAALASPLDDFAGHALARRLARVGEAGDDLSALPADALHRLRIQAKRLRYAAEFFAPLYPPRDTRRFIRRVASVQERLGRLNDGAVVRHLMEQLGGGDRAYAVGVVRGFVAAGLRDERAKAERSWRKLRRASPFWS